MYSVKRIKTSILDKLLVKTKSFTEKKSADFVYIFLTKTTVLCCYGLMLGKRNYPKTRQHYPLDKSWVNCSQKYEHKKKGKKKKKLL